MASTYRRYHALSLDSITIDDEIRYDISRYNFVMVMWLMLLVKINIVPHKIEDVLIYFITNSVFMASDEMWEERTGSSLSSNNQFPVATDEKINDVLCVKNMKKSSDEKG